MTDVLVLGAGGRIARWAIKMLAEQDIRLTLLLRDAKKLNATPDGATVIQGDVLDQEQLDRAMRAKDAVYANLAGNLDAQAAEIVRSMSSTGVNASSSSPPWASMTRFLAHSESGTAARLARCSVPTVLQQTSSSNPV